MAAIDKLEFDVNISENLLELEHYGKRVGENWPVVYILNNSREAYIGETHHASVRMNQHMDNPERRRLTEIRIISGEDFNKSVILDLEAFLIKHMGADGKYKLQNGNNGLQDHDYYNRTKYEEGFQHIWKNLKKEGLVEHSITEIENSNLYKYSPYKTLGTDQRAAEQKILEALAELVKVGKGVTIIVRGGAGTGKTILAIYLMTLFADINRKSVGEQNPDDYLDENAESVVAAESIRGITKIGIIFPQATLKESVKDIFKSISGLDKKMVMGTTEMVDEYLDSGKKYDLLIVDEAHRLKCRYNGHLSSYAKFDACNKALELSHDYGTELDWIMKCSWNQIIFRDELQTVRPCDITADNFRDIIDGKYNTTRMEIALDTQWRCLGGNDYINYLKELLACSPGLKKQVFEDYDFKIYTDVNRMVEDIKKLDAKLGLCRNAAGYAWKWISKKDKSLCDIEIQGYKYRWNSTYKNWIASDNSINEIGCIHTLQGYDLNYVGVIIGNDLKFNPETKQIYADKDCYFDQQGKSGVASKPEELKEYIKNIYLTLMTRGIKGTYLYICDEALREYFMEYVEQA